MDQAAGASVPIREQFEFGEKLGEGSYGEVWKAEDRKTDETRALKKIKDDEGGVPCTAYREITLLERIQTMDSSNNNIVRLHGVVYENTCVHLVLEHLDRNLKDHMDSSANDFMNRDIVKSFLHQILLGIDHCHSHGVIHRDLKPQNLLINRNTNLLKLADFGLAREIGISARTYSPKVATLWYRAPEILLGAKYYSKPIDVWSAGCIFAEMVNQSRPLFEGNSEINQLLSIFSILGTPSEETWSSLRRYNSTTKTFANWQIFPPKDLATKLPALEPAGIDLLSKMLRLDPSKRISAGAALKHHYFNDLHVA